MNKKETAMIMAILKAGYPSYYKNISQQEALEALNLWAGMFQDDSSQIVLAAVKTYIATDSKGFPPTIGAIKEAIFKIQHPDEMTEMEAWTQVAKAMRNSMYNSKEEFDKLSPIAKQVVGSHTQLKEWAMMETDVVQSVIQSNFMRSYKARSQSNKEFSKIPKEVLEISRSIVNEIEQNNRKMIGE